MRQLDDRWVILIWILFFVGLATSPILAIPWLALFGWLSAKSTIELIKKTTEVFSSKTKLRWIRYSKNIPVPANYNEYIKSDAWKILRDHTLDWMHHRCEFCSRHAYQVHHIRYPRKKAYLGTESIKSLAAVCRPCHSILHGAPVPLLSNSCVFCDRPGVARLMVAFDHYNGKSRPWVCKKCDFIARGYRQATLGMSQSQYDAWVTEWRKTMPHGL